LLPPFSRLGAFQHMAPREGRPRERPMSMNFFACSISSSIPTRNYRNIKRPTPFRTPRAATTKCQRSKYTTAPIQQTAMTSQALKSPRRQSSRSPGCISKQMLYNGKNFLV